MSSDVSPSPLTEISTVDKGDDTQRRYRFQAACAAMIALQLLDDGSEYQEVFCEQHEDILVCLPECKFVGIQVKTRLPGKDPFKPGDKEIVAALSNFILLDLEYPDHFLRFILGTNYAFWTQKNNSSNLQYILQLAREWCDTSPAEIPSHLQTFLMKLSAKLQSRGTSVSESTILSTLSKIVLESDWPKLDDFEFRIAMTIPTYFDVGSACYDDLLRVARSLINRMLQAASLQRGSIADAYFSMSDDPESHRVRTIIEGKRITPDIVRGIIRDAISAEILLLPATDFPITNLPQGMNLLETKMANGRITARNISNSKDLAFSTHRALNSWIYKYGPEKAKQQYQHVCMIVRNECQESHDENFSPDDFFGQTMMEDVRHRLRNKHHLEPQRFFGLTYEHLVGMAGVLTELCEIWWSPEFQLSDEVLT